MQSFQTKKPPEIRHDKEANKSCCRSLSRIDRGRGRVVRATGNQQPGARLGANL
jgi:hypothetical protein